MEENKIRCHLVLLAVISVGIAAETCGANHLSGGAHGDASQGGDGGRFGNPTNPPRRVPVSFSEPLLLLSLASICASVDNAVFFGCFYWAEHVVIAPRRLFSAAGCRCFSTAIWLCPLSGVANMLNGSTLIKGRWKIVKKIGAGAFGANEPHSAAPA